MKLESNQARKTDPGLREALESASPDEVLRAILALSTHLGEEAPAVAPEDYPDRTAYRKALIERQQEALRSQTAATRQALHALSLDVHGGTVLPTVVVQGPARSIAEALRLPGVLEACLDREFTLGSEP